MNRICVFCGSRFGILPEYKEEISRFGRSLAVNQFQLIYGAGAAGLMGAVANGSLDGQGQVLGIIPQYLADWREVLHPNLTETVFTGDLMERKKQMFENSDAFVVFPGGLGTLDELFEILTWKQLRQMHQPVLIVNHKNFWDPLLLLIESQRQQGFVAEDLAELFEVVDTGDQAIQRLIKGRSLHDQQARGHQ